MSIPAKALNCSTCDIIRNMFSTQNAGREEAETVRLAIPKTQKRRQNTPGFLLA